MPDWRRLISTFGVPILLAVTVQWALVLREEARATVSVETGAQQHLDYTLGAFLLQWRNGSINIVDADRTRTRTFSLWHTPEGKPFLSAARSTVIGDPIQDGHYFLKEKVSDETKVQTVDRLVYKDHESFTLEGWLRSPALSTRYIFTFAVDHENAALLNFSAELVNEDPTINRIILKYGSEPDEAVFGFGQHYSRWNLKGSRVPVIISEQGVGRGLQPLTFALNFFLHGVGAAWHTTYVAKPTYVTSHLRSLLLYNSETSIFDLTKSHTVVAELWATSIKGAVVRGHTPLDLVTAITSVTGRMKPLPSWTQQGAIIGLEGGSAEVQNITSTLLEQGAPLVGVWLQDWVGTRHDWDGTRLIWNWEVNREYYPGWSSFRADMASRNVRLLTYMNPYLVDILPRFPFFKRNLFQEAVTNGYFVKNSTGQPLIAKSGSIEFGTIDPTNPHTRKWLKDVIITNMVNEAGSSGWMADFGEYLPFKSQLHAGSGEALHNLFPDYWASLQLEAVQEAAAQRRLASPGQEEEEENDLLVFVRSGSLRTPGLAMCYWVGDQLVTWDKHDGIKTVLPAMLSGGLSGHSLTHSDIGGYTMIDHPVFKYFRPRELLYRWIEMGAFAGAVFRTHLGSFMHTPSAQVWDDVPTVAHFSRFARIFAALAPYRRALMDEAWEKGWPLIRPLFLHHPDDRMAYHLDSQFLLGEDLLVAPVLDPGRSSARVYLPAVEGGWVHAWTSRLYGKGASKGEWVIVPAPLGQPPVFYRFDSPSKKVFELIVAQ